MEKIILSPFTLEEIADAVAKKLMEMGLGSPTVKGSTADEVLMTASQAAAFLQSNRSTLWKLRKAGKLRCIRLGKGIRFRKEDLLKCLETSIRKS